MRNELDMGLTFFVMRADPWEGIAQVDRDSRWHVGAIIGEALSHTLRKLIAEATARSPEAGFQAGAIEPGVDESTRTGAGLALDGTSSAKPIGKGRKRGPTPDYESAACVAHVVARMAPNGDWHRHEYEIREQLDKEKVPFPKTWSKRDSGCHSWVDQIDRAIAVRAIEYALTKQSNARKPLPKLPPNFRKLPQPGITHRDPGLQWGLTAKVSKIIFGSYDLGGWQERHPKGSRMATANTFETLLNEHDVARVTGLTVASVRRWLLLGQGPKYLKIGAAVRYEPEDITAWIKSRPSGGGQQGWR